MDRYLKICSAIILAAMLFETNPVSLYAQEEPARISMDFDGAPVKEVLKIFSQQTGMNFITNKDIEDKTATVHFENVTVEDALNSIMAVNNLSYFQEEGSNIAVVYSADTPNPPLITTIFKLKFTRLSVSPLDVAGDRTITDLLKSEIPEITNATSTSSSSTQTSASKNPNQKSFVQKGVDQMVASLLSPQGKLTLDLPSNSLIITDTPEKLRQIEKVIKKIDVPSAQVLLEVYVMEVKKDILDHIGVDWGGSDGALFDFSGATAATSSPFSTGFLKKTIGLSSVVDYSAHDITVGSLGGSNFAATLRLIKDNKDTKILAQPRVLTLNNEAATIQLVSNSGVALTNITVASGSNPVTTATVERAQLGVSLKMTPQIDDDDTIQLFLEPAVSTAVRNTALSSSFNILDPTTRIIRTIARVKNEQTLVIGGLMDNNKFTETRKIPLLGDIPGLGKAFSYEQVNNADREIIIFITPHILRTPDQKYGKGFGKDLAASRMLNAFEAEEMEIKMDAIEALDQKNTRPPVQVGEEMDKALNNFNPKNTKFNR